MVSLNHRVLLTEMGKIMDIEVHEDSAGRFVVEFDGRGVGVLIAAQPGYTFFAAERKSYALDGMRFTSPSEAQLAVDRLYRPATVNDPSAKSRQSH